MCVCMHASSYRVFLLSLQYHYYSLTPIIQNFIPFAGTFGETITTYGKLYANSFANLADADSDEANYDHFTRLLVGGMPCDHNPPDNTTQ